MGPGVGKRGGSIFWCTTPRRCYILQQSRDGGGCMTLRPIFLNGCVNVAVSILGVNTHNLTDRHVTPPFRGPQTRGTLFVCMCTNPLCFSMQQLTGSSPSPSPKSCIRPGDIMPVIQPGRVPPFWFLVWFRWL